MKDYGRNRMLRFLPKWVTEAIVGVGLGLIPVLLFLIFIMVK